MKTLIQLRQELHKYPEVSGNEKETAKRVLDFLSKYPPSQVISNLGGVGVLAIYEGKEVGKSILFRCELDALPIQEINSFDYKSIYDGVSHKCGHDGHMAILCGIAKTLHENPLEKGTVMLLFQPAEEDGSGAQAVMFDAKFKDFQPDYAFALHNLPGFPLHQIIIKENAFTCAVNSIAIELYGKTSHAGEPENGINPAIALSEIHFTVRSDSNAFMQKTEKHLEQITSEIAKKHNLKTNIHWTEKFQANENNNEAVNYIRKSAINLNLNILEKVLPFTFGEDFGLITQHFKGAMFGLGSGENTPSLHNPDYDFPDEIIETGSTLFYQITKEILDA